MIPYNGTIRLHLTKPDRWGIDKSITSETHKAFLNYSIKTRGTEINTSSGSQESVPVGSVIIKGFSPVTPKDYIEWTNEAGLSFKIQPEDISYIKNTKGKVMFTKMGF